MHSAVSNNLERKTCLRLLAHRSSCADQADPRAVAAKGISNLANGVYIDTLEYFARALGALSSSRRHTLTGRSN